MGLLKEMLNNLDQLPIVYENPVQACHRRASRAPYFLGKSEILHILQGVRFNVKGAYLIRMKLMLVMMAESGVPSVELC